MIHILNKATCECCGLEIKWWPENEYSLFSTECFEVVKKSTDICIVKEAFATKDNISYRIHCNFCHHENTVMVQK
jgi:hypothetical protein